jgi:hypothetical protein
MRVSPTGITISFGGTPGGNDGNRPVVARISGFATETEEAVSREMVVPAGESIQQLLPQGLYNVQLTLPSGRIIQRNVKIAEDTHETYRFFEDFAPGAGFSLQEAINQPDRDILAIAANSSGNTSGADYEAILRKPTDAVALQKRDRDLKFATRTFPSNEEPPLPPRATLVQLDGPIDPVSGTTPDAIGRSPIEPAEQHGDSALWRIHYESDPPEQSTRRWARVALPNGGVELASLPLPWFCPDTNKFSSAEVLVDPARSEGAATSVAVRDRRLAGLLAFLDRGQASSAAPLLAELERQDIIGQTIWSKMSNPLAACAAAYVGLAVYPPNEHEQWDVWLSNCMERFPGVPDAAIVHARRLVLRPTSAGDNALAAEALRLACAAGTPFFSAGVLLLREMLILLSADHEDLKPLAKKAGILAGRLDASQAFTVLRYAPAKAVAA